MDKFRKHNSQILIGYVNDQKFNDFWEFVYKVEWKKLYKISDHKKKMSMATSNAVDNILFIDAKPYGDIYDDIYDKLSHHFKDVWLDDRYNNFMPSDDGYSDLLSSIIGFGKKYIIDCLNDDYKFVNTAKKEMFSENFGYIFHDLEKESNRFNL